MSTALFWHRRDLRIGDNAGLYKALRSGCAIQPVFVFDSTILRELPENDQRVLFIHREVARLKDEYRRFGADLHVVHGDPIALIPKLALDYDAAKVFTNRDYEPAAIDRDRTIGELLAGQGRAFIGAKDQVIFDKSEIVKPDGKPYTVFTPYMRRWKETVNDFYLSSYPNEKYTGNLLRKEESPLPTLSELGFSDRQMVDFPDRKPDVRLLATYHETRDIPAIAGTSRLSVHLRFGTVSIRELARMAKDVNEKYFNELVWRDFYQMILYHFPHSATQAFRAGYDRIRWEQNDVHFRRWCEGTTGYPLVDAGMRELDATGFMHNRVRMVVASFLTKHLLLDWRLGERYFAGKLLDFDLASNVGGWQWAAGSGCDAAPYFRVFNPKSQQEKFDPDFSYIRKWVPEFGTARYPDPVVDHKSARERAIARYKEGLRES